MAIAGGPLRTSRTTVLKSPDEGFDAMLLAQDAGSPGYQAPIH